MWKRLWFSYNYTLKRVNCECAAKYRIKELYEIKIDKDKLKAKFNIKNLINIKVLKCYKEVFTKKGLIRNYGSYIFLSIIFLYIISLIFLILKDYSSLKKEIEIYFRFFRNNKGRNKTDFKKLENHKTSFITKLSLNSANKNMLDNENEYPKPIFNEFLEIYKRINMNSKIIIPSNYQKKQKNKTNSKELITQGQNEIKNIPEKMHLAEFELNNLSYKKALLYDKRNFCQYFISLFKFEHLLLFAIIPNKDYNSIAIKICIFLFSFGLFFVDNAIFMNEDAIHNIYEDEGEFDFIYQIPQIIYSNVISFVIDTLIRFLSLSSEDVIDEKKKRIKSKDRNSKKFFKNIKIKYIFFFIISFLFLFSFWFYISCFCYVYSITQIYLIKDTLISFGLSLVSPIYFYFISSILRICSLQEKNRNILFSLSKFVLSI